MTRHKGLTVEQRQWKKRTRANVIQGIRKGRTFRRRRRAQPEGLTGIRDQDFKEWLCLGSEMTSCTIFGETVRLEIMERIARSSIRIKKN
jgi:hypothetical protein